LDPAANVNRLVRELLKLDKPVIAGESGLPLFDPNLLNILDPDGWHVHDMIWAVSMAGSGAMPWWWDNYIHPRDLYGHYAILTNYWDQADLAVMNAKSTEAEVTSGGDVAEAFAIAGGRHAFAWVRDRRIANNPQVSDTLKGVTLRICGLDTGKYKVEFWNTQNGKVTLVEDIPGKPSGLDIALPSFTRDLAVKVIHAQPALVADLPVTIPRQFALLQNFPNPFGLSCRHTTIAYELAEGQAPLQAVELKIFDLLGREIRTLFDGLQRPGRHIMEWDGRDRHGQPVVSGMYIYRLVANGEVRSKRMMVVWGRL
jgi:hypothetical protein